MSFGAPGGTKRATVKPPERGSFPIDHDGDCKELAEAFKACMKGSKQVNIHCRREIEKYLQCRMDNNLMAVEDMTKWQLGEENHKVADQIKEKAATQGDDRKERGGFVAGRRGFEKSFKE